MKQVIIDALFIAGLLAISALILFGIIVLMCIADAEGIRL